MPSVIYSAITHNGGVMLQSRDVVRHNRSRMIGVVLPTSIFMQNEGLLSVLFEGERAGVVVEDLNDYEVIGHEEPTVNPKDCGVGEGERACVFCVLGSKGLTCMRYTDSHWKLVVRMIEKGEKLREPTELYPNCTLKNE